MGRLRDSLCRNFCCFYKPSKDHEQACMGFLVVERLIKKGMKIPFHSFDQKSDPAVQKMLIENMCVSCPFYESDCDFVRRKGDSPPCGGLILLAHLLGTDIITIDNIKDVS